MMEGELPAALFTIPFLAIHFLCSRREKEDAEEENYRSQELQSHTTQDGGAVQTKTIHGALYGFDGKWENDYGQEFDIDAGIISMEINGKTIQQKILVDEKRELFLLQEPEGKPSVWSMPMHGKAIWSNGRKQSIKWTRVLENGSSFDYAWTDSEFQPGDEVYLVSLYADMDLNGQEGVVIGAADETGKCLIRLHASGEQVCVFEKNLSHIENKTTPAKAA